MFDLVPNTSPISLNFSEIFAQTVFRNNYFFNIWLTNLPLEIFEIYFHYIPQAATC